MRSAHRLLLASALLLPLTAACGESYWQVGAAEDARELPLLQDVEVIEMTREEFAARAAERTAEYSEEFLREYADTYGRMGYFDIDIDLRPILTGSSSDWVGATYSPTSKLVTLVGEARDDVLVHEIVHAIQDQHFVLTSYDIYDTSDGFLARRAVVEGDATMAQYRFILKDQEDVDLDQLDWQMFLESWHSYSINVLADADYPVFFLDYLSFTYPHGITFSAYNLLGVILGDPAEPAPLPHDWTRQDELYGPRAPYFTRQILELDIDGVLADSAPEVGLSAVPEQLADSYESVDWDSMGEWFFYLLFLPLELDGTLGNSPDGPPTGELARALASGWVNDRVLFARADADGEVGVVWASVWDDSEAASAVAETFLTLYDAPAPEVGYATVAGDGETVWLEQRDEYLVVIKNLPEEVAATMAEDAVSGAPGPAPRTRPSLPQLLERMRPQLTCGAHGEKSLFDNRSRE